MEAPGALPCQVFLMRRRVFVVFDGVGTGAETTADLRGFNTGSVATSALVAVDGVRVNEPDTGYVNFELIPLSDVERIEVVRGSSSALFGEGGLGGGLNVGAPPGAHPPPLHARLPRGGLGGAEFHGSL